MVRDARREPGAGRKLGAWAVLFVSIFISMTGSKRYFDHYFIQLLPFVVVPAGRFFQAVAASPLRPILLIGLLVPFRPVVGQCKDLASAVVESGGVYSGPVYAAVDYLKDRNVAGEYAYFTQDHIGYLLTDTRVPFLFVHPSLLINEPVLKVVVGPEASTRSQILAIFGKKPRFVCTREPVWYMEHFPEAEALLHRLLARDYGVVEEFGPIRVYERRETSMLGRRR